MPVNTQLPVPADSVIVQLPPAPLTATVPVGVPLDPLTVAVIVVVAPTVIVEGAALKVTVAAAVLTVSVVVPLALLYFASPP